MSHSSSYLPVVVILGAGYAGLMACARVLRSRQPARIIVVNARSHFEQRIRLHETLAGHDTDRLALRPMLEKRGVTFLQTSVTGLNLRQQQIELVGQETLHYDYLIYALGSVPQAILPGSAQHAFRLESREQMQTMQAQIQQLAEQQGRLTVLGGGLTALEAVTELAEQYPGLRLALISRRPAGEDWPEAAREHLQAVLPRLGVEQRVVAVSAIEAGFVRLADGSIQACDLCLDCTGFRANPLAMSAGLPVDEAGRLVVESDLRLPGFPNVWVAGDAARLALGDDVVRMACATAMPMGAQAGMNVAAVLAGRETQAFGFRYFARFVSLGRQTAVTIPVDGRDQPLGRAVVSRAAVRYKEWICRMTIGMIRWELRTGLPLYVWPRSLRNLQRVTA